MAFKFLITFLAISTILMFSPSLGQIMTPPCTPSMITSFTPCVNFVTNSSFNSTAPTPTPSASCCSSLSSLMSSGKDCLCQIANGNVPFQIPINQTLAISLPRACNMPGVPLQCKAIGAPVPAPGPLANGPTLSPNSAPSPSTKAPAGSEEPLSPTSAPEADQPTTPTLPSQPSDGAPTTNTGSRAGMTPSAASTPFSASSPLILVAMLGAIAFKYY